jgi:hypothetical protein
LVPGIKVASGEGVVKVADAVGDAVVVSVDGAAPIVDVTALEGAL